ncbi:hypothetical protein F7725_020965 [Dissostichus mawsoni]|uniref:SAM domain-containing protein n=1 Tax=Dissostichus mawsoni TaxID=36200 RepID=A0A7J5YHF6_DISMA|nr:hypothetical protein F7725_020965 [Dissostichus mawsoni]
MRYEPTPGTPLSGRALQVRQEALHREVGHPPSPHSGELDPGPTHRHDEPPGGATPTHTYHQRWSNPGESSPSWGSVQHTCRRPLTEYRMFSPDFSTSPEKEWEEGQQQEAAQGDSLKRDCKPQTSPNVPRSMTGVNLSEADRSTSFGRFDIRNHSPQAKPEENGTTVHTENCETLDPNKSAGLGKKMKAISLTMRRKMGKKHAKSFLRRVMTLTKTQKQRQRAALQLRTQPSKDKQLLRESLQWPELLHESNGSGQRDSLRLEEDGSYQGQFSGRARVGDIINIISKPPMGIWIGMLNNKVGNFKFIYVDMLVEKEEEEEEAPKIRQQKLSKRPRPKTLLELLERLNLEEYASALLLNGYQTVEDLLHLQEKHLIELNVHDPEDRRKILAAAECCYTGDEVKETEEQRSSHSQQEEDSDCPRDSGCFIPSECTESKEDTERHTERHTEAVDS